MIIRGLTQVNDFIPFTTGVTGVTNHRIHFLKGIFDTKPAHMKILVTGSARLETFRQSGDSLAGRYFRHRLLPFSPAETGVSEMAPFLTRGGFPEPFLAEEAKDADRWRMQYVEGLIRTDILDFEKIQALKSEKVLTI
jgi:hypothetical protein